MPTLDRPSIRLAAAPALLALLISLAGCGEKSGPQNAATPAPSQSPASEGPAATVPSSVTPTVGSPEADQAWSALQEKFSSPPAPPESWATQEPDEDALREFQLQRGKLAVEVADLAKDFYTRFPQDGRAAQAQGQEMQLLDAAIRMGQTNVVSRLASIEEARSSDPTLSEEARLGLLFASGQRAAQLLMPQGEEAVMKSLEKTAKDLIQRFPHRSEPYQMLLEIVGDADPEHARETAQSLLSTNVPEEVRKDATNLLARLDLLGKPLDLSFTAVDGREVDLAKLRGKVVLIDFWATWCGPCIAELPNVKAAYERLHPKGFEIVGISFDQEKEALEKFVAKEAMPWPQYFDGKHWDNDLGKRFGIKGIPTMWLIDKQGVLRDNQARSDLENKVERLLAESPESPQP